MSPDGGVEASDAGGESGRAVAAAHTHLGVTGPNERIEARDLVGTAAVTGVFMAVLEVTGGAPVLYVPPFAAITYLIVSRERPRRRFWAPGFAVAYAAGAGWLVHLGTLALPDLGAASVAVTPVAATTTVLLTGLGLWAADVHLPPAFATGLLVLVFDIEPTAYLVTVAVGSALLSATALCWHLLVDHR